MSHPDYELNAPTTQENILKMLELIYKKISLKNVPDELFYIKIPVSGPKNYLNYSKEGTYFISNKEQVYGIQTKFTQEEIDKMKEDSKLSWLNIEQCKVSVGEVE